MACIAIIYFSQTHVTAQLAEAIARGAKQEDNITVLTHSIAGHEIIEGRFVNPQLFEKLIACDAIIFGSPTYMGNVAAQFKAFADASSEYWQQQVWSDKLSAGFTSGTGLNGDQTNTLHYLSTLASQHGMLWVNLDLSYGPNNVSLNRLGCQLGVVAQTYDHSVNKIDLATALHLGKRVAKLAKRLTS